MRRSFSNGTDQNERDCCTRKKACATAPFIFETLSVTPCGVTERVCPRAKKKNLFSSCQRLQLLLVQHLHPAAVQPHPALLRKVFEHPAHHLAG